MARETKKKEAQAVTVERSLEQMMLDRRTGKYQIVPLAAKWALVLRRKEEFRHLNQNEILDIALRHILGGEVSAEDVAAQASQLAAETAAENGEESKEKAKKK